MYSCYLIREYLRDALVIVKLKKTEMAGDYARVLHKLSGLLKKTGSEIEGIERETEAVRIRVEKSLDIQENTTESIQQPAGGNSAGGTGDADEKPYDDLVYILWR